MKRVSFSEKLYRKGNARLAIIVRGELNKYLCEYKYIIYKMLLNLIALKTPGARWGEKPGGPSCVIYMGECAKVEL